ncbi:MipA/OmpV family protein [Sphingomonas parva]|uniref:MipA/OmpV family protein n=1 Tax=Sphingomonas parva TaxID=2555898 RepID=A0A4Y8ZLJ1_9SPHN|nr:MipA/OmpV family protein [Sphingomonas parva]TFI56873.1 MipA/OmpV family protein [Sphingomonas parva]
MSRYPWLAGALLPLVALASPAPAQQQSSSTAAADRDDQGEAKPPRRWRVGLGVQAVPSFPGSDSVSLRPLVDVARARGDEPFEFEAPDESFGFPIVRGGGFEVGPALNIEGSRKPGKLGAALPKVSTTFEAGAFVSWQLGESFRLRAEGRKGLGGHDGWVGNVGADYVARNGDAWLFSIGPRVTLSDRTFNRAYFGVTPADAAVTGLAAFDPNGGVQAIGGTAGLLFQLSPSWGVYSYAKYDRLVSDAGRSPVVRQLGSRDQFSGGLALTYTWGGGRKAR